MFIRKKKNKSGKISVQVIDKSNGHFKVIRTVGCSAVDSEIRDFVLRAEQWLIDHYGQVKIDFNNDKKSVEKILDQISGHNLIGLDLTLGKIFDSIGFNSIEDKLFKFLVLYRILYPKSKLKTTEFLYRYHGLRYDENQIYRYLDKLSSKQKELVQQISFTHTKDILGGEINVVFYDVTTIYFEIEKEDDLRKTGFSKEGKHQNPQIVLGLLVSTNGYPLAYEIFNGNQFEGQTIIPVIDAFKQKFKLDKLVVVADSGLLSKSNIEQLKEKNYDFIIGARIKSETEKIKHQILQLKLNDKQTAVIKKEELRLIINYSDKRAQKDAYNRQRGLKRLEKQIKNNKLTKAHINNKGYNKYLKIENQINVSIDYDKFNQDAKWDGLKGFITNSSLKTKIIIENYNQLWQIEKAFRVSKTDLKVRPIYHRLQHRIEAHICLNFVAYNVYKELERFLKLKQSTLSAAKIIEIAANLYEIEITLPQNNQLVKKKLILTQEQKDLAELFNF